MQSCDLQTALGVAIRIFRKEHGFSQEEFADLVGLHRTYIGGIERGERNVSLYNLNLIAIGLGVELSTLIIKAELIRAASRSTKGTKSTR